MSENQRTGLEPFITKQEKEILSRQAAKEVAAETKAILENTLNQSPPQLPGKPDFPQVIRFLLGEDSLDGRWYGDEPGDQRPSFWWRTHLRKTISDLQEENDRLKKENEELRKLMIW